MQIRTAENLGRIFTAMALVTLLLGAFSASANGQPEIQEIAPPPLKIVSKEELGQLDALTDVKKRTRTALELMSARLTAAETLIEQDQLDDMYKQLGGFHGLMDNTLAFLDKSDSNSRKVLNNYKRFEMGLREFRPRLELIRRSIPLSHELYVRNLINYLRDARSKAIEPFFSNTVVPTRSKP
jgi:hypothetical protein